MINNFSKDLFLRTVDYVRFNEIPLLHESISVLSECIYSDLVDDKDIIYLGDNRGFIDLILKFDNSKNLYKLNKVVKTYIDRLIDNSNYMIEESESSSSNFNIKYDLLEKSKVFLDKSKKLYFLLEIMNRKVEKYNTDLKESEDILEMEINMDLDDESNCGKVKPLISKGRWLFKLEPYDKEALGNKFNYKTYGYVYSDNNKSLMERDIYELEDACDNSDLASLSDDIKKGKHQELNKISSDFKDIYKDYTHIVKCSMGYYFIIKMEN